MNQFINQIIKQMKSIIIAFMMMYGVACVGQVTVIENGNVGVGVSTPDSKLHINNDARIGTSEYKIDLIANENEQKIQIKDGVKTTVELNGTGTNRANALVLFPKGIDVNSGPTRNVRKLNALTISNPGGNASTSKWVHIKLTSEPGLRMYMLDIKGFNQQTATHEIYDFKATCLIVNSNVYQDQYVDHSSHLVIPDFYKGSDGTIYLKFKPAEIAYMTLWVDLYASEYGIGLDLDHELTYTFSDDNL
jgi:hypothetical protein